MNIIFITIIIVSLAIVFLGTLGYIQKNKEEKWLRDYNEKSIQTFMDAQKRKKQAEKRKRQKTPKVPSIK